MEMREELKTVTIRSTIKKNEVKINANVMQKQPFAEENGSICI